MCIRKYNFLRLSELLVVLFLCNAEPAILTNDVFYFFVMTAESHDFISFFCFSLYNQIIILHIFRIFATLASYLRRSEFVSRHDKLVSRLSALFSWFLSCNSTTERPIMSRQLHFTSCTHNCDSEPCT